MFFPACATLANKHPDLRSSIEELDRRLAKSSPTATFQPSVVAAFLRVDTDAAADLLKAITPDVLVQVMVLRCPRCQTLNDADIQARTGEVECSQCQHAIPLKNENWIEAFRFSPQSKRAIEKSKESAVETQESPKKQQYVVLLHGIRTSAQWQGRLRRLLERPGLTEVQPIKVGFVDVFTFLLPMIRKLPINEVRKKLDHAVELAGDRELVIVAHSFGTYTLARILEEFPRIRPIRVILCGSVLPLNYQWAKLRQQPQVLNDYGSRDYWPALATLMSWGYGPSGTFGFGFPGIRDRAHAHGHSDFFTDEFVNRFWVPFVHEGRIVESEHDSNVPTAGWLINILAWGPLKYVLLIAIAAALYFYWRR